jgi:hypothetical protein
MACTAMATRARLHLDRRRHYLLSAAVAAEEADEAARRTRVSTDLLDRQEAEAKEIGLRLAAEEAETAASRYPAEPDRVMPTRLGNTLRRYEDLAGRPYGLEALAVIPHLMDIAEAEQVAHVDDARTELDLAVRVVVSWLLVAATGFGLLWPYGSWLALPIAAYGLAWLSYRAARTRRLGVWRRPIRAPRPQPRRPPREIGAAGRATGPDRKGEAHQPRSAAELSGVNL